MSPDLVLMLVAGFALAGLSGREVWRARRPVSRLTSFNGRPIIEIDVDRSRQSLRRWLCRRVGHVALADERGRPVTAFYVCARCGKIGGRIE